MRQGRSNVVDDFFTTNRALRRRISRECAGRTDSALYQLMRSSRRCFIAGSSATAADLQYLTFCHTIGLPYYMCLPLMFQLRCPVLFYDLTTALTDVSLIAFQITVRFYFFKQNIMMCCTGIAAVSSITIRSTTAVRITT